MGRRRDGSLLANEERVLVAALALNQAGTVGIHGYDLATQIAQLGRSMSVSTLYRTLDRLEERGLFTSELKPAEGRGPAKRVYVLTGVGIGVAAELSAKPGRTASSSTVPVVE